MTAAPALTWGLVIATYQREEVLLRTLDLACRQTRPPLEVVIVDASSNWESTREKVLGGIARQHQGIAWTYVAAEHRSSTLQRNQGILLATADILFLFDDDSLMYPDCAERIMSVYEADAEGTIIGVESNAVGEVPTAVTSIGDSRQRGGISETVLSDSGRNILWKHGFLQRMLILDTKEHFIPYDGSFKTYELSEAVKSCNVASVRVFDGFRMTYRRRLFERETFEPLFRYYAVAEDADLSYRASRYGALVVALDARLHHFQSGSGRLATWKVSALTGLNMALVLKKNSNDLGRDKRRFYRFIFHLMLIQFLKDGANRRWAFPKARGLVFALRHAPKLFAMKEAELAEWYPAFQSQLIQS